VLYKDTYTDNDDYKNPLKTTLKRYEIELQRGIKKKKEFFVEPGLYKSFDYLGRVQTASTFRAVSGRETLEFND